MSLPARAWDQIHLNVSWNEQEVYEILRPVTLFGETAAERATTTGIAERTLARKADLFDASGMASLFDTKTVPAPDDRRLVPADIRQRDLTLKYETRYRFFSEDVAGLADKSRAPKQPTRKVDFAALAAVRRLQVNPELGEFRIHAALKELGIHLSPRTCGRILALNRQLGLPAPAAAAPHEPREMPFAATYRHEYWSVDVHYREDHQLEQRGTVYVISVLDNYSRALLASILSPRQDLTAFLLVLREALRVYGCPTAVVSDGGSIFKAKAVLRI